MDTPTVIVVHRQTKMETIFQRYTAEGDFLSEHAATWTASEFSEAEWARAFEYVKQARQEVGRLPVSPVVDAQE